jgi:hypothetical protein
MKDNVESVPLLLRLPQSSTLGLLGQADGVLYGLCRQWQLSSNTKSMRDHELEPHDGDTFCKDPSYTRIAIILLNNQHCLLVNVRR